MIIRIIFLTSCMITLHLHLKLFNIISFALNYILPTYLGSQGPCLPFQPHLMPLCPAFTQGLQPLRLPLNTLAKFFFNSGFLHTLFPLLFPGTAPSLHSLISSMSLLPRDGPWPLSITSHHWASSLFSCLFCSGNTIQENKAHFLNSLSTPPVSNSACYILAPQ